MSQIVERFEAAVQALVGDGPVKNRLRAAYTEYLEDLQQVDLPIQGKVGEFLSTFKAYPPRAKAASFTVDQALETLQKAHGG